MSSASPRTTDHLMSPACNIIIYPVVKLLLCFDIIDLTQYLLGGTIYLYLLTQSTSPVNACPRASREKTNSTHIDRTCRLLLPSDVHEHRQVLDKVWQLQNVIGCTSLPLFGTLQQPVLSCPFTSDCQYGGEDLGDLITCGYVKCPTIIIPILC